MSGTTNYISEAFKTFYNDNGYEIGRFEEGVYKKKFQGSKHILRKYDALGIDKKVVLELNANGCYEIRAKNLENGVVYTIPFKDFQRFAILDNLGAGNQLFCPLKNWNRSDNPQIKLNI